jgi:O-antigen/teichoic acid export membrane protein
LVGGLVGKALRYTLNIVIANGLGASALGVFALGMVLLRAGSVFARLGLDNAAQKYIPVYITQDDDRALNGTTLLCLGAPFLTGVVIAGGVFVLDDPIQTLTDVSLRPATKQFAVGIPFFATMMVGIALTKGLKETKYQVYIRDIGQSVVAIVAVSIGAFVLDDLMITINGYILSCMAGSALALYFLYHCDLLSIAVRPRVNFKRVFAFALPLTAAALIQYLLTWTDILMLSFFRTVTEVGWYQAAYQTSVLLLVVLQAINSIFPSVASDLRERGESKQLNRTFASVTKWITYVTSLGCVFVVIYADEILYLFDIDAPEARLVLMILCLGQAIAASTGPAGFLLMMCDHERLQLYNSIAVGISNVVLNVVLIGRFGVVGAGAATAISSAILNAFRIAELNYFLNVQPYSFSYWKGGVAVICATPVLLVGARLPIPGIARVLLGGAVALAVFAVVAWGLGIEESDRALLEQL